MKQIEKFTAKTVEHLKETGLHSDGNGLYLQISIKGSKSWIFRYRLNNKVRDMGLGSYPVVSLAQARKKVAKCKILLSGKKDPIFERDKERNQYFKQLEKIKQKHIHI